MNLLMDDVSLDARPGETVIRLAKRLPDAPPPAGGARPDATEANLEAVAQLFHAFAARDADRLTGLVDRGVMMEPLSTPVERRTPYLGVSGLRRYLSDLDSTWDEFQVTVDAMEAKGDYVVALGGIRASRDNHAADDEAGFTFKLRDEKVVWAKVYDSHDDALAAAGLE
jgi:ketosteroid isomerase-like protein